MIKSRATCRTKSRCQSDQSTVSVLANRSLHQDLMHSGYRGTAVPNVCLQGFSLFTLLTPFDQRPVQLTTAQHLFAAYSEFETSSYRSIFINISDVHLVICCSQFIIYSFEVSVFSCSEIKYVLLPACYETFFFNPLKSPQDIRPPAKPLNV